MSDVTVVGSSGFLGALVTDTYLGMGRDVVAVDRVPRQAAAGPRITALTVDLLTDELALPVGAMVLVAGTSDPRANRPWQLVLEHAVTTARLLPSLVDRDVTLVSSVEVYGRAVGPLREDTCPALPLDDDAIRAWCIEAVALAAEPCPPSRAAPLCRRLAEADPSGRWVYALAKRAQELLVASVVPAERLTVFRSANVFGVGQDRVLARLARRALAGLPLTVTDSSRSFLSAHDLVEAIARGGPPGLVNASVGHLALPDLAALVLEELGLDAVVDVLPGPADDTAGVVDGSAFRARLGGLTDEHLTASMRAFVRLLRDEPLAPIAPCIPVVIPHARNDPTSSPTAFTPVSGRAS